ncbi:hypothetical protein A1O1_00723 [Capronia coronata CBS 617.96]|uniref:Cytochrome P450 n=1 Tax=Capronia coronata CBS 617.96 TaxID=1182541 RepID=W9Z201_9EURO|nr:uncharacterized protein A1O1_00723 [Capronia coronata CBS 617.96]EXJ95601.1 hypothetical protein A1O1_00723 [Capronia coronata CBS 617.96]
MMQLIARTSNRVFVGLPWCRNQALLDHGIGLHAVRLLNRKDDDLEKKLGTTEPNDFLQWSIHRARDSGIGVEQDPDIIAERILSVNFAAIHTSTFSITNTIFDLLASDPSSGYIRHLRDEAQSTLVHGNGVWTKQGIAKMYKTDSTLRESTRLGSFLGAGLLRKVVCPDGITAPNGTICPFGSMVSVPTNGIHNDPNHYPDAATYRPFRFSSQREGESEEKQTSTSGLHVDTDEYIKKANLSFVSTSPIYHPFGHGRHACPGRFFAANELKLILAYMVLNYEFDTLSSRPESIWIGTSLVLPMKATIRIRRRSAGYRS